MGEDVCLWLKKTSGMNLTLDTQEGLQVPQLLILYSNKERFAPRNKQKYYELSCPKSKKDVTLTLSNEHQKDSFITVETYVPSTFPSGHLLLRTTWIDKAEKVLHSEDYPWKPQRNNQSSKELAIKKPDEAKNLKSLKVRLTWYWETPSRNTIEKLSEKTFKTRTQKTLEKSKDKYGRAYIPPEYKRVEDIGKDPQPKDFVNSETVDSGGEQDAPHPTRRDRINSHNNSLNNSTGIKEEDESEESDSEIPPPELQDKIKKYLQLRREYGELKQKNEDLMSRIAIINIFPANINYS